MAAVTALSTPPDTPTATRLISAAAICTIVPNTRLGLCYNMSACFIVSIHFP